MHHRGKQKKKKMEREENDYKTKLRQNRKPATQWEDIAVVLNLKRTQLKPKIKKSEV